MAHDWRTPLWNQFRKQAETKGLQVRFPVFYERQKDYRFEVSLVGNDLRVTVNEDVLKRAHALDRELVRERMLEGRYRDTWEAAYEKVLKNSGKSVGLNTLSTGVLVPIYRGTRTSPHINVYMSFYTDPADISDFLTDEQNKVLKSKRGTLVRLKELALVLFPLEDYSTEMDVENEDNRDDESEDGESDTIWTQHHNVIFFGPPGTGKSYRIKEIVRGYLGVDLSRIIRVTFHPETSYFDFVGSYRPAVGWVKVTSEFENADGVYGDREPRAYYQFEPGPLSHALAMANAEPEGPVVLVIEEINRGNVAAIFGDVFQLLDRNLSDVADRGWSEYPITPSSEWSHWLRAHCDGEVFQSGKLRLPPNLYLYATMNTSDQSLYPMDTAFRRRWGMQYVGIRGNGDPSVRVPLHRLDHSGVRWLELMERLNIAIVEHTRTDDKQMGPFFVRAFGNVLVDPLEFQSKVLFYLWSDIFRDRPEKVFRPEVQTWEDVVARFENGQSVLREGIVGINE